jgi:hypothetical protein
MRDWKEELGHEALQQSLKCVYCNGDRTGDEDIARFDFLKLSADVRALDTRRRSSSYSVLTWTSRGTNVFFTCTKDGFPFAVRKTLIAVSRIRNFALLFTRTVVTAHRSTEKL